MAAHGLHGVVPVEEIRPKALFEFLLARRGSGRGVDTVPLARARRPMIEELRKGGLVAIAADRDLSTGAAVQLPDELAHQVVRVLRCRPGDHIMLLDGSGAESEVRLDDFGGGAIRGVVLERGATLADPPRRQTRM